MGILLSYQQDFFSERIPNIKNFTMLCLWRARDESIIVSGRSSTVFNIHIHSGNGKLASYRIKKNSFTTS